MGSSFQREMRSALDEPMKEMPRDGRPAAQVGRTRRHGCRPVRPSVARRRRDRPRRPTPGPRRRRRWRVQPPGRRSPPPARPRPRTRTRTTRLMAFRRGPQRPKVKTPDDVMTLTEHLGELRVRIIRMRAGDHAVRDPRHRVLRPGARLPDAARTSSSASRKPAEFCGASHRRRRPDPAVQLRPASRASRTRLRIGMYGGLILAMPVVLWQVWQFIVPALHRGRSGWPIPFILSSVAAVPARRRSSPTSRWRRRSSSSSPGAARTSPRPSRSAEYVRLVMLMIGAFGVGLQFPILLVFLQLAGVLTPRQLVSNWRYALVGDRRHRRRDHPVGRPDLARRPGHPDDGALRRLDRHRLDRPAPAARGASRRHVMTEAAAAGRRARPGCAARRLPVPARPLPARRHRRARRRPPRRRRGPDRQRQDGRRRIRHRGVAAAGVAGPSTRRR